jgi:prepilin-type N-terminal cleavage/methylation domain-containing protein
MKTVHCHPYLSRDRAGFSLVEMIGVLAIIAILAVIIVPRVFSTIASSRVTQTVASINSMKTTVTDFAAKFGTVPTTNNNSRIDDLLFTAGMMESRFQVKLGTQPGNPPITGATWAQAAGAWTATGGSSQTSQSRIICVTSNTTAPSTANGANYRLNGTTDLPAGSRVISAVVVNLTANEARELSDRLDGASATQTTATTADDAGRVVYRAPNAQGLTTAYVYLAHQ